MASLSFAEASYIRTCPGEGAARRLSDTSTDTVSRSFGGMQRQISPRRRRRRAWLARRRLPRTGDARAAFHLATVTFDVVGGRRAMTAGVGVAVPRSPAADPNPVVEVVHGERG